VTYLVPGSCYIVDCPSTKARRYVNEWLCEDHAPEVPVPDPDRTLSAIRIRTGRTSILSPFAVKGGTDLAKEKTGGYVSRERAARIAAGTAPRQETRRRR
jgi:hypothetical protein